GERLEAKLAEIAAVAPRYGATHFAVYRSRDDRYRFLQVADFASKLDWERYWYGPEFEVFRTTCASWYQVPVTYAWQDIVAVGGDGAARVALRHGAAERAGPRARAQPGAALRRAGRPARRHAVGLCREPRRGRQRRRAARVLLALGAQAANPRARRPPRRRR